MRSPKQPVNFAHPHHYRYYAGYSNEFVEDMLDALYVDDTTILLDPWNGSGTTTTTASLRGVKSFGFDINPAAVIIGRARLLGSDIAGSIESLAAEIVNVAERLAVQYPDDPLGTWFGPSTTIIIRRIEAAIHRVLIDEADQRRDSPYDASLPQSSLAAGFYMLLFRMVRGLVKRYVPSNPTWIKDPSGRKLGIPKAKLVAEFRSEAQKYARELDQPRQLTLHDFALDGEAQVTLGRSTNLPLPSGSISAVLSSPPYCTRIDYVKATLPELAVLGLSAAEIRQLRDQMIGTPTMAHSDRDISKERIGETASDFLQRVRGHSSRASSTYYRQYYEQYFDGMSRSLDEIRRVLADGGRAALVVQDSYYKDVHLDLAAVISDMGKTLGWKSSERIDFVAPRTMASINRASRRYRSTFRTVESALVLQK